MYTFRPGDMVRDSHDNATGVVHSVRGGKTIPGLEVYTVVMTDGTQRFLYSTRMNLLPKPKAPVE